MGGGWMKGGGLIVRLVCTNVRGATSARCFFKVISTGLAEAESNYRRERGPV